MVELSLREEDESFLRLESITKVYASRDGPVRALDSVSVEQPRGEFLSILGPSGCGKSTLLMIAAGLIPTSSGIITANKQRVTGPRTDIGIVFQSPVLLEWRTALGNVMLQAEARKLDRAESEVRARELLASVGLHGFEDKYPHELSGGMRQRVALCRALLLDPPMLLMDEPFGALDALTREQMQVDLLAMWQESQKTVLFVTHSISEAVFLSDRIIVMTPRPGKVCEIIDIDIDRPRDLNARDTAEFGAIVHRIRILFQEMGVIHT